MQISEMFDTAGPLRTEALPEVVGDARREAAHYGAEQGDFTPMDDFAGIVGGLITLSLHKVLFGVEPDEVNADLANLISNNLGEGPASLGYLIGQLAQIMLVDPLDDLPVIDR